MYLLTITHHTPHQHQIRLNQLNRTFTIINRLQHRSQARSVRSRKPTARLHAQVIPSATGTHTHFGMAGSNARQGIGLSVARWIIDIVTRTDSNQIKSIKSKSFNSDSKVHKLKLLRKLIYLILYICFLSHMTIIM